MFVADSRESPFLLVAEVATRLRCSERSIHELTRTGRIPHLKRPGARRCLFRLDWLEAWEGGAALELVELERGGRIVRPLTDTSSIQSAATWELPAGQAGRH